MREAAFALNPPHLTSPPRGRGPSSSEGRQHDRGAMEEVPVLIIGGGPVGLTASILLSQAGVRSLLVERHPGTAIHPKARGINARSMEMYRQCGVEAAIRQGRPASGTRRLHRLGTHAGRRGDRTPGAVALRRAERGRQSRAQLPVRPGRPRTGAAGLCRAPGRRSSPFRHRSHRLRAGRYRRHRHARGSRERHAGTGQGPIRDRRRRRPEHHPPAARRADASARRTSTTASTSC